MNLRAAMVEPLSPEQIGALRGRCVRHTPHHANRKLYPVHEGVVSAIEATHAGSFRLSLRLATVSPHDRQVNRVRVYSNTGTLELIG